MGNVIEFDKKKKKESIFYFCKKPKSMVPKLIGEDGNPRICSNFVQKCNSLIAEHDMENEK